MRRTLKQLAYDLFMAGHSVRKDHYYRHQASGKVYKVIGHVIQEATGEPAVLYRPAAINRRGQEKLGAFERSESECVFSRPLTEFVEEVQWTANGETLSGPRFKEVRKVESWTDE